MNDLPLLEDLRLFCLVANKQSFASAARELGVSKALISKRIGILEASLKIRLLHRTPRSLSLTESGRIVCQSAQRILDDTEQMVDAISATKGAVRGQLRICAASGFGRKHLARAIFAMTQRYPDLEFQLELIDRPVDLIREGFDLDVRMGQVHEENLIVRRLMRNSRVLCASGDYLRKRGEPRDIAELVEHSCIVIRECDQEYGYWKLEGPDGTETVRVKGALSTNNGQIAHQWAIDGAGIVLRSLWDVGPSLRSGALRRILPAYEQKADGWARYPVRLSTSAKMSVCVQFLQEWFADENHSGAQHDSDLGAAPHNKPEIILK
ncbi:LysR family transcriptional regulator [Paraburkholderia sp. DGU8]|uniref:LysR family transcriptional regulator n=1 Tax=Paraburkholderia sp. DGU8 TaxID=3161997 RepID=UPI003467B880